MGMFFWKKVNQNSAEINAAEAAEISEKGKLNLESRQREKYYARRHGIPEHIFSCIRNAANIGLSHVDIRKYSHTDEDLWPEITLPDLVDIYHFEADYLRSLGYKVKKIPNAQIIPLIDGIRVSWGDLK